MTRNKGVVSRYCVPNRWRLSRRNWEFPNSIIEPMVSGGISRPMHGRVAAYGTHMVILQLAIWMRLFGLGSVATWNTTDLPCRTVAVAAGGVARK